MTRNEKKAVIESMAEKFMNIDDLVFVTAGDCLTW